MNGNEADRKIGALKAVIQMALPQLYGDDEQDSNTFFRDTADEGDPLAITIANELTGEEIEAGFKWGESQTPTVENELDALPVAKYLEPEQRERVRFGLVAMDAADTAYEWAMEAPAPKGNRRRTANRRIGLAEEVFVTEILQELCDDEVDMDANKPPRQWLEQLPERWRKRATRDLDRVLERVAEAVGKKG